MKVGSDNPFDTLILSSGLTVDLTGTEEEVNAGLRQSLALESSLFNRGVTCDLKDGGQDCLTCPMYVADRAEEARAPLCRLGRDQRVIEKRAEELVTVRRAPLIELADHIDGCMELGHGAYEELLEAVAA